ncbi:MAG TPA: carbon storage regulator [Gemmatimonadaceae bacterium]|jgi:carbon storage regulator|nr:carbon storage regulator [Gemmatimonadaceae bacterium]
MLILGRRVGETLLIGDDIKIFVLHCDRTSVRLGIEAPSTVTILRGEIAPQQPAQPEGDGADEVTKA